MLGTARYITLDAAQKMMAAAEAAARKKDWKVCVSIVDVGGNLIMFQKMDGTQMASIDVSMGKARTAAGFKRSTKALEDMIAGGRTAFVAVPGILPVQGGLPVVVDGEVLGAVGVSGLTSPEDEEVATAAIEALKA